MARQLSKKNAADAKEAADKAQQSAMEAKQEATKVAAKVEAVRDDLNETNAAAAVKVDETLSTVRVVHTLVNNSMGLALKSNAELARRLATLTRLPEDEKAARVAESAQSQHDAKQLIVDENKR